ncbi:MAG: hypothetical protein ACI8TF_000866 [Paracoccaceae bacterium]
MINIITPSIEDRQIAEYCGIVVAKAILGATALVGVDLNYEATNNTSMVSSSGTRRQANAINLPLFELGLRRHINTLSPREGRRGDTDRPRFFRAVSGAPQNFETYARQPALRGPVCL